MENKTSAGRLLNIIKEAKSISSQTQCIDAWGKILNTNKSNMPLLFKRLGAVMALPSKIEKIVLNTNGISDTRAYLNWLGPINQAFMNQNLSSTWDTFSKYIDQHTINYLTITTDMLNLQSPETNLKDTELEKLKNDFLGIEKEINEAELDIELKNFMLKRIRDILNAIDEYKLNGIEPLMDSLNITIGQIILNNELAVKSSKEDFAKKFWNLIVNTSVMVTLLTGVPQIANNLQSLLPLLENNGIQKENFNHNENIDEKQIIDVELINDKTDYA